MDLDPVGDAVGPPDFNSKILSFVPTKYTKFGAKGVQSALQFSVGFACIKQKRDLPHPLWLLRMRRQRPRCSRAAESRDELAPPHSITSSARASSDGGIVSPSALAVLRLITSSYLIGVCTGRSAGFSPLRMRST